ncbi:MAG: PDZ domain-containing protein [Planctomycetia bacterium]|mgnify:CR=1 FL=1|nr:PDZ domain-containing protein [Planctomycetia bacterium]
MKCLNSKTPAILVMCCALSALAHAAIAQDDLSAKEEAALRAAVAQVASSVVKIEALGGLEKVGDVLLGDGPTTGLIVTPDGYIVSSIFNFAQKPASILVTLPDGTRTPATWVAADKSRMLVLLKVNAATPLSVAEASPLADLRPGQWAIAVGRTFDTSLPQYSVGIVSALDRIWGKAVQTDAMVSPNNYGGPLVDIQGRVIGVLAPFSPDAAGESAGVEWYDSGIGFAVPYEHIQQALPRLREGKDLTSGVLGISLKSKDIYGEPPLIAICRSDSPAYQAGLRVGDRIVAIDGRAVDSQAEVKHAISPRYAGDSLQVKVARGDAEFERAITLIEKLKPYRHAFLGILPRRDVGEDGVRVRFVYPDSPAAKAGMQIDDRLVSIDAAQVADAATVRERLNGLAPEQSVRVEFRRGDKSHYPEIKLAALPETVPDALPAAAEATAAAAGERPAVGQFTLELPEYPNRSRVYVPADYDPRRAYGLLVYLHAAGGEEEQQTLDRWKAMCDRDSLILLAPQATEPKRWQPEELPYIRRAVEHITGRYTIDPSRTVAVGREMGASLAYQLGFQQRDLFRGVAAIDGPFAARPTDNDPAERLAFYVAFAKSSPHAGISVKAIEMLRELHYPVTTRDLGDAPRELNETELGELSRWIDTLDKL